MPDECPKSAARSERLREVLLGYLQAAGCPQWPGTDGLMLEDVLRSYPANAAAGRVPDRQQLLREYPELREALLAFFADQDGAGPSAGP
jgi:selenocysteine lyase/cysteine desulfurase